MKVGATVVVEIEVPRGSLVKWGSDGRIDFLSPVPSPFNYGSVPDSPSEDGDGADAIVLGPRLPRGSRGTWQVLAIARFTDQGLRDDKLICGRGPLRRRHVALLSVFFRLYTLVKKPWGWVRGRGPTRFAGIVTATSTAL